LDLANLFIRGSREQGGPQRTEPVHQGIEPLLEERDNARGEASAPLPRLEEYGTGSDRTPEGGTMSEELLNLDLLKNEELDGEGHAKKDSAEGATEAKGDDEVEAHLLSENLLDL